MYDLSNDYLALHALLMAGHKAVGFVDHKWNNCDQIHEDVCQIERKGEFTICIYSRGIQYAAVYPFDHARVAEFDSLFDILEKVYGPELSRHNFDYKRKVEGTELALFINACMSVNLRWIKPASLPEIETPGKNNLPG